MAKKKKIKIDNSRCSGCKMCQLACSTYHFKINNPKKGAIKILAHFPAPGTYELILCNQCGICFKVCPEKAIYKKDNGAYIIDPEKCTNCKICQEKCPINAFVIHKDIPYPLKCDLCGECVTLCPTSALFWS